MHEPIAPSSILGRAEPLEAVGRTDYQARHGGGSMSAWAGVRAGLNLIRIAVIIILVAFVLLSGLLLFVPAALREAGAKAEVEQAVVGWLLAVAVWTLVAAALMYLIGLCRCLTAPPSSRVPDMVWAILGCHALGFLLSLGSRLVELSPYSVNWGANCLVLVSLAFVVVSGIMFVACFVKSLGCLATRRSYAVANSFCYSASWVSPSYLHLLSCSGCFCGAAKCQWTRSNKRSASPPAYLDSVTSLSCWRGCFTCWRRRGWQSLLPRAAAAPGNDLGQWCSKSRRSILMRATGSGQCCRESRLRASSPVFIRSALRWRFS